MSKVYAWERLAFPGFATTRPLSVRETCELIRQVHEDVRGRATPPTNAIIKMTKRGGACASWFSLNFTPDRISLHIALHEIAHSLTWCPPCLVTAEVKAGHGQELSAFERHLLDYGDNKGHGPEFVACYIALLEHYADADVDGLLKLARGFPMQAWGPKVRERVASPHGGDDNRVWYRVSRRG
jgi:hypothetical protein